MFRKVIVGVLVGLLPFTFGHHVSAEDFKLPQVDVPAAEQDVGEAISPLKKGDRAPFSGVHLSPKAVAKIKVELDSFDDRLKIETDRTLGEAQANFDKRIADVEARAEADKKISDAKLEYNDFIVKQLDKRLQEEIDSRPSVMLIIAGTVVVTAAVTVLTYYVASQSSK